MGDIPRSSFQFDYEFERKILAEAEKESQNWSKLGLENLPSKTTESTSSLVRYLCFHLVGFCEVEWNTLGVLRLWYW